MRTHCKLGFIFVALLICVLSVTVCICMSQSKIAFADDSANVITIQTDKEVVQGNTYYAYVYVETLENIASLNVSVHYDASVLSVSSTYNRATCSMYDSAKNDDSLSYTYLFDVSSNAKSRTCLFYFSYQIKNNANVGRQFFDVTVDDAYDSALNEVAISGGRYYFTVNEKSQSEKTCRLYGTNNVSSKINEEFEIAYSFSTSSIASGTIEIQYDDELFGFVSLTQSAFLSGKIVDVNSKSAGKVYVSFAGTEYNGSNNILSVKFRTMKNVDQVSQIKCKVSELYDLALASILCDEFNTTATVSIDDNYVEDKPKMSLSTSFDAVNNQVILTVILDENSHLGAGDFAVEWDKELFTFAKFEKLFTPSFFNVNDKQISNGILKFSIISMSDITDRQNVIQIVFGVNNPHDPTLGDFVISGSALADSMTNAIVLNFVGCKQSVEGKHVFGEWQTSINPSCTNQGEEQRICSICELIDSRTLAPLGHDFAEEWTIDLAVTCITNGSKSHHCSRCDAVSDVTKIDALGHDEIHHEGKEATCTEYGWDEYVTCSRCDYTTYKKNDALEHDFSGGWTIDVQPTCTSDGSKSHHCSRCDAVSGITKIDALGHDEIHHDGKDATCLEYGWYEYVTCSRCDYTTYMENPALGHDFTADWMIDMQPTCTDEGSKSRHCSRCDEITDVTGIAALGHNFGEWTISVNPTYENEGEEQHACSTCGEVENRSIPKLSRGPLVFEDMVKAVNSAKGDAKRDAINRALSYYDSLTEEEKTRAAESYDLLQKEISAYEHEIETESHNRLILIISLSIAATLILAVGVICIVFRKKLFKRKKYKHT